MMTPILMTLLMLTSHDSVDNKLSFVNWEELLVLQEILEEDTCESFKDFVFLRSALLRNDEREYLRLKSKILTSSVAFDHFKRLSMQWIENADRGTEISSWDLEWTLEAFKSPHTVWLKIEYVYALLDEDRSKDAELLLVSELSKSSNFSLYQTCYLTRSFPELDFTQTNRLFDSINLTTWDSFALVKLGKAFLLSGNDELFAMVLTRIDENNIDFHVLQATSLYLRSKNQECLSYLLEHNNAIFESYELLAIYAKLSSTIGSSLEIEVELENLYEQNRDVSSLIVLLGFYLRQKKLTEFNLFTSQMSNEFQQMFKEFVAKIDPDSYSIKRGEIDELRFRGEAGQMVILFYNLMLPNLE